MKMENEMVSAEKYDSLCIMCPRKCGINRNIEKGFCGMNTDITLAKACLHKFEEPCISWKNGAGTIFFSGCNLHCVFCQNNKISNNFYGKSVTVQQLSEIILSLQENGADNIELVTPTHFADQIIKSLDLVKNKLNIPVIYNCGGYELSETIKLLDGYIDIYMPDIKYFSSEVSSKYSNAYNYFEYASKAVLEMIKQVGKLEYNSKGGLLKGTLIRHLVLPGSRHDSLKIMDWISQNTTTDKVLVSIMNQYTPFEFIPDKYVELKRKLTTFEYNSVVNYAAELNINGFTQKRSSADPMFVPEFDLSGI